MFYHDICVALSEKAITKPFVCSYFDHKHDCFKQLNILRYSNLSHGNGTGKASAVTPDAVVVLGASDTSGAG